MKSARARLMGGIHAEGLKRGFDHDGLRGVCRVKFGVESMAALNEVQLAGWYRDWTGKSLKRGGGKLPGKGYGKAGELELVSGDDLAALGNEFARRGWGPETQANFIRRQLGSRHQIRTRRDWWKVFAAVRAMNKRESK